MSWTSGASVQDVLTELNVSGTTGPFTVFGVGGVLSGTIFEHVRGATAMWTQLLGDGLRTSTDTWVLEALARFETHHASATLGGGQLVTDGFNYSLGGMDVQRVGALQEGYRKKMEQAMEVSKRYLEYLRERAFVFNPTTAWGKNEQGQPVTYWNTTQARY